MWLPNPNKLVKLVLHENGRDVETPWVEDLGPAPGAPERRLLRLANVPFLHAKPTYEDVVEATPGEDGRWTWDKGEGTYEETCARLAEDSGRWAMIVAYELRPSFHDSAAAFRLMDIAGEAAGIAVEGCSKRPDGRGGRAYAAVPKHLDVEEALRHLATVALELTLEHPLEDED